jgi:predicted amidohydrolase/ribosomal protein S18 acetylase RimI-like enzyme
MTDNEVENSDKHYLKLRQVEESDYDDIRRIMTEIYPSIGPWEKDEIQYLLKRFPEGQVGIEDNGKIVAAAFSLIVDYSKWGDRHSYDKITAKGKFTTHTQDGDTLYGIDVFVDPAYRGMRLGRRLYDARKEICYNLNLQGIIAGGRIPGYEAVKDEMTPQEYVKKVRAKELVDPILTFQLSNGFHVRKILKNYMSEDKASQGYATLLEWLNIYHEPEEEIEGIALTRYHQRVKVGVVQWQMRILKDIDDFLQQVEYFVDAVSSYGSDVILFPEFFNAALMGNDNDMDPADAVRVLASHSDTIRKKLVNLAVNYNINIIGGSVPEYSEGRLRNVAYLCRRDGTWDEQHKIHITPHESDQWGMVGGDTIKVFDTDFGKIGILICYDAEFPELGRIMGEQDVEIIFVPYWTDTKNAYQRVRYCAQARAIENECYVVLSGSTGNLPSVTNMDMQYSQAAVLTPSDFTFPHDCIAAEATPNTEMTLIADLDLNRLTELHENGSVRNLKDRRKDLYETALDKSDAIKTAAE